MGRRWWTVAMVVVAEVALGSACVEPPPDECGDLRRTAPVDASPAYRGFRFACAHAPGCPDPIDCAAPRWRDLDDRRLDDLAACVRAPCEVRAACVVDVTTCRAR